MSSITRDEYGIFENELGKWYIDTPKHIYGEYDTQVEAIEELEKAYPAITCYVIVPYSETVEWTGVWIDEEATE